MIHVDRYDDATLLIRFPYSADLVAELKGELPRWARRWDPDAKGWRVALSLYSVARSVIASHTGESWYVTPAARAMLEGRGAGGQPSTSRSPEAREPFTTLHLLPTAPDEVVQAAYRALALLHHPDRGGNRATMARINSAFESVKAERSLAPSRGVA